MPQIPADNKRIYRTNAEICADMADWEKCGHLNLKEVDGHGVFDDTEAFVNWCSDCGAIYDDPLAPGSPHRGWIAPHKHKPTGRQTALRRYRRIHGPKRFFMAGYWRVKLRPSLKVKPYVPTEKDLSQN